MKLYHYDLRLDTLIEKIHQETEIAKSTLVEQIWADYWNGYYNKDDGDSMFFFFTQKKTYYVKVFYEDKLNECATIPTLSIIINRENNCLKHAYILIQDIVFGDYPARLLPPSNEPEVAKKLLQIVEEELLKRSDNVLELHDDHPLIKLLQVENTWELASPYLNCLDYDTKTLKTYLDRKILFTCMQSNNTFHFIRKSLFNEENVSDELLDEEYKKLAQRRIVPGQYIDSFYTHLTNPYINLNDFKTVCEKQGYQFKFLGHTVMQETETREEEENKILQNANKIKIKRRDANKKEALNKARTIRSQEDKERVAKIQFYIAENSNRIKTDKKALVIDMEDKFSIHQSTAYRHITKFLNKSKQKNSQV